MTGCSERSAVKPCSAGLDAFGGRDGGAWKDRRTQVTQSNDRERERERERERDEIRERHWKTKHEKVNV